MNPSDYRLLFETVYGEWKRCHALYLDLVCQIACGARVPPAIVAAVRAEVELAMADLASMSHQTLDEDEIAPGHDVFVSSLVAMVTTAAGGRAMAMA
jgi:hypothetical protein